MEDWLLWKFGFEASYQIAKKIPLDCRSGLWIFSVLNLQLLPHLLLINRQYSVPTYYLVNLFADNFRRFPSNSTNCSPRPLFFLFQKVVFPSPSYLSILSTKTIKNYKSCEILPYLQAYKLTCCSIMTLAEDTRLLGQGQKTFTTHRNSSDQCISIFTGSPSHNTVRVTWRRHHSDPHTEWIFLKNPRELESFRMDTKYTYSFLQWETISLSPKSAHNRCFL